MTLHKLFSFLVLLSLLVGFTGASQPTAQAANPTALVAVSWQSPDDLQRFQATGLPAYALLDGYILAGADSAGQLALAGVGLPFQVLDAELTGGYYLASRMPSAAKIDWSLYGRLLLDLGDQALLQTGIAQVKELSLAGAELRYISLTPVVLPVNQSAEQVFPEEVTPDPIVQMVIDQVDQNTVSEYDRQLAGELPVWVDGDWYTITTRDTYSGVPMQKTTNYVGQKMAAEGLDVEYHIWGGNTYPNVIGEITGLTNPDDIYIIGAHLDDVSGTPGADDNASGSVATMLAAELLSQYQWSCTVRFAYWTGEEYGLLGSAEYAQRSYQDGENILGYLNLDMIAWNTISSQPGIDLLYNSNMPQTQQLAQLMSDVVYAYDLNLVPQLVTSLGGGSDHSSFWDYGYTAILGIEDQSDFNPYYHGGQDTPAHTDLAYFTDFTKAAIATFMHMSGCVIVGGTGNLDGTVTAADGGAAISGADVQIDDGAGHVFSTQTDASGYYTKTLVAGDYTVTASAYGYLPETVSGVTVVTDTLTTQDFSLLTAPTYTISGMVTEVGSGAPLYAHITFDGSPDETWTDPGTGYYQITLPEGEYTMHVAAELHRPQARPILLDQDQTQDFLLETLPCILLVDDDQDGPDVLSYYTDALDGIGAEYDVWDVGTDGDPALSNISGYNQVYWFLGYPYNNTFNSTNETVVAGYLDAGGNFFLSGQDYLYDMGLDDFGQDYLHIGSFVNDENQTSVTGQNVYAGLGPYSLSYPFTNYSDIVSPDAQAQLAFSGNQGNAAISYDGDTFNTIFLGYPLEAVSLAGRQAILERTIDFFGGCEPTNGQLEGQVTDAATGDPLQGALITAEPTGDQATTDLNGNYVMSLSAGDYQVTASLDGYVSQTLPATIAVSETTVLDFALEQEIIPPEIDITPTSISATLFPGEYTVESVTVTNLGGSPLSFTVSNPDAATWLDFEPANGKLDPSASQVVSVTLDTTELGVGVYTTTLEFASDDPVTPLVVLPVALTVVPACVPVSDTDFTWTPETPLEGEVVTFTASVSGSQPISYYWEFSDGITSTVESPARTFASGVYTITLTTSNDCGVDEVSYTITVAAPSWWVYLPLVAKK